MRTSINRRRLSIESLENRVIFAADLGLVEASSLHSQGEGEWHSPEVASSSLHHLSSSISSQHSPAKGLSSTVPIPAIGPIQVEPLRISIANEAGATRERNEGASENFNRWVREQGPEGQSLLSRPYESTVNANRSGPGDDSSAITKLSDDFFASRWDGRKPADSLNMLALLDSSSEDRREISWFADRSVDFIAEPFPTISLPDAIQEPAAHSWSLVFGIASSSSPFAVGAGGNGRSSIDKATVLEIVADGERVEQPMAEPEATYPSNGWKATSILAAALSAAFYRKKSKDELAPLILAGIRRLRLPSSRH